MKDQLFNDLANVVIYHYVDVRYEERAKESAKRLVEHGVKNIDDINAAYEKYEDAVVDYALTFLPDGYDLTHDYWGAKCISNHKGWNAPKTGTLYAGDAYGQIMMFNNFDALVEYTNRIVEEIDNKESDVD